MNDEEKIGLTRPADEPESVPDVDNSAEDGMTPKRVDAPKRRRDLKPLGDRVIVRVIKDAEVLASGIVIPDSARERSQRGIVLAAGPGRWENGERVPLGIEVGDVLLFSKYGGTELPEGFDVERQESAQLVLREADILCIESFELDDEKDDMAEDDLGQGRR